MDFNKTVNFDTLSLWEKGDNCSWFKIHALCDNEWKTVYEQDRILPFHTCYLGNITAQKLRVEITDCKKAVSLRGVYVYQGKKQVSEFKVSQYLRLDIQKFSKLLNDEGFSGYYDTVTDVILFEEAYINEKAQIAFNQSEELFSNQLQNLRKILRGRPYAFGVVFSLTDIIKTAVGTLI